MAAKKRGDDRGGYDNMVVTKRYGESFMKRRDDEEQMNLSSL